MTFAKPVNRDCFFPGSSGQVYLCSKVVSMSWISATGVIQHVHRSLLTSPLPHLRCLDPAAEIRRDRPLPDESSQTTGSLDFVCSSRGRVSRADLSPGDLYVGRGTADSVWAPSIWDNPFRVSEVGSAARAVKLCGKWLFTQKDLFSCHVWTDSVYSANAINLLRVTLTRSSRSGEVTVPFCLHSCDRKCASTTLMCSRCVTGQTCRNSSTLDTTRALLSHESGMNASRYHVLSARKLCERCTRNPWVIKSMGPKA